jgi:hypothetical protein
MTEQVQNYFTDWKKGDFFDNSFSLGDKYSALYNSQKLIALANSLCNKK